MLSRTFFALGFAALIGCSAGSGSTTTSSGEPNTPATTSCSDVCAKVSGACGALPPGCDAQCAQMTEATRQCVVRASSCQGIDRCGQTTSSPQGDAGSNQTGPDATNPCKGCTSSQFCVTQSSVASEIGSCFDAPATCNGSTKSLCPCLNSPATGPCSKGAKGCSEGLWNTVSCL